MTALVLEKAIVFGDDPQLCGILCSNREGLERASARPVFVFLNSGILHRIGACRLHVKLARKLAHQGFVSFRFDHAGLGDSEARKGNEEYLPSTLREIRLALDLLERRTEARSFILAGLCSGADMGYEYALQDERVVGLMQLDPYVYRTIRSRWLYFRHVQCPKLRDRKRLLRFFGRLLQTMLPSKPHSDARSSWFEAPEYIRKFPPKHLVEKNLRMLLDRGVRFLLFFSAGQPDLYNYEGQFQDAFHTLPLHGRLEERFFPKSTHIFTGATHQEAIVEETAQWATSFIPNPQGDVPGASRSERGEAQTALPG